MARDVTEWYGTVRGCYVVIRGGTGWYGVVRSGVIDPALDIRSILLVNGGTLSMKEYNIIRYDCLYFL